MNLKFRKGTKKIKEKNVLDIKNIITFATP